jgi:8-oxo-dGTP pyrophosphatase MutT (NUDIX family)
MMPDEADGNRIRITTRRGVAKAIYGTPITATAAVREAMAEIGIDISHEFPVSAWGNDRPVCQRQCHRRGTHGRI